MPPVVARISPPLSPHRHRGDHFRHLPGRLLSSGWIPAVDGVGRYVRPVQASLPRRPRRPFSEPRLAVDDALRLAHRSPNSLRTHTVERSLHELKRAKRGRACPSRTVARRKEVKSLSQRERGNAGKPLNPGPREMLLASCPRTPGATSLLPAGDGVTLFPKRRPMSGGTMKIPGSRRQRGPKRASCN